MTREANKGTIRGARHLNDDIDTDDARDEDRGSINRGQHSAPSETGHEGGGDRGRFGEVREGDSTGFGHPLSYQGTGFFNQGVPFEQTRPHTGRGNAVGYGPGQKTGNHPADGGARGKGPRGYKRSDERIAEDVNDGLTQDTNVDATDITVVVNGGEVTLNGTVTSRIEKCGAEDLAHDVSGVTHVQNNLRIVPVGDSHGTT